MSVHHSTVRKAIHKMLSGNREGQLTDKAVKKILNKYGGQLSGEKVALYRSLTRLPKGRRLKHLEAVWRLHDEERSPKELRSGIFGITKAEGVQWHKLAYFLFGLTVKQLRQVGAVVRGEVPKEVRDAQKDEIVAFVAKGTVPEKDRPQKLSEVYANALEISQWDGLEDMESVRYQKGHEVAQKKRKKRRRSRRVKASKPKASQPAPKPKTPKADPSDDLEAAFETFRSYIEDAKSAANGTEESRTREIVREELRSEESREVIHEVVDQRVEEKLGAVSLDLSFA